MANRTFRMLLLLSLITGFVSTAIGQTTSGAEPPWLLSATALKEIGLHLPAEFKTITEWSSQLATLPNSEEFTLYWEARSSGSKALTPAEENKVEISRKMVVQQRRQSPRPPRGQGTGQVWGTEFVFVAVGDSGEIKGVQISSNPRLMFLDAPKPNGALVGGQVLSPTGTFQLVFPAYSSIQRILVYQRTPDEKAMHLRLFTTIEVDTFSKAK